MAKKRQEKKSTASGKAGRQAIADTPPVEPQLHPLQKFAAQRVHRSKLQESAYNPRNMKDAARDRLSRIMKKHGLANALVWNSRTGNLISGHQRLAELDRKGPKDKNYLLDVNTMDLSIEAEKELNIAMNNTAAMGEYSFDKLEEMVRDSSLSLEGMGFDEADVSHMFGAAVLEDKAEEVQALADNLRKANEAFAKKLEHVAKRDDVNFYLVFKGQPDRQALTTALGLPDSKYVQPKTFIFLVFKAIARYWAIAGVEALDSDQVMDALLNAKDAKP